MATYINVKVSDIPLVERAKEDSNANRRSKLEENYDESTKEKAEAELKKVDAAIADEKDERGPLSKRSKEEPAAYRNKKLYLAAARIDTTEAGNVISNPLKTQQVTIPFPSEPYSEVDVFNPPGTPTFYRKETYEEYTDSYHKSFFTETGGDSAYVLAALPAGGETMVIVMASRWDTAMAYTGFDYRVRSYSMSSSRPYEEDVTYLVPFFSSVYETRSGSSISCIVVGKNFCKQVATPQTLQLKLEPFLAIGSVSTWTEPSPSAPMEGTYTPTSSPSGSYMVTRVGTTGVPQRPNFSGGYDFLRNFKSNFVTPGIYKFLEDPSMLLQPEPPSELRDNEDWVWQNYFTGVKRPPTGLYTDYDRMAAMAELAPGLYTKKSSGIPASPKYLKSQYSDYQLFWYVWDWGDPDYCRTKLMELGFTTAQLNPDPPPSQ